MPPPAPIGGMPLPIPPPPIPPPPIPPPPIGAISPAPIPPPTPIAPTPIAPTPIAPTPIAPIGATPPKAEGGLSPPGGAFLPAAIAAIGTGLDDAALDAPAALAFAPLRSPRLIAPHLFTIANKSSGAAGGAAGGGASKASDEPNKLLPPPPAAEGPTGEERLTPPRSDMSLAPAEGTREACRREGVRRREKA